MDAKCANCQGEIIICGYRGKANRHATIRIIPVTCVLVWGNPPNYRLRKMAAGNPKSVLNPAKAQRRNTMREILGNAG